MSSLHIVVVWEWDGHGWWWPYPPTIARQLERAHEKKLTRVVLADADPEYKGTCVNLRTLTQTTEDAAVSSCMVQRSCYSVGSAAGKGARWEWAPTTRHYYDALPMELQCRLEDSCKSGTPTPWGGWLFTAGPNGRGFARSESMSRVLRRVTQAPYPLARPAGPPVPASRALQAQATPVEGRRSRPQAPPPAEVPRSVSPRDRDKRHGLARQILHNLNIFSSSNKCNTARSLSVCREDPRRHSVDTVSTYLSHESKGCAGSSVGDLLNCSAGSDDVFSSEEEHHYDTAVSVADLTHRMSAHTLGQEYDKSWCSECAGGGVLCVWCARGVRGAAVALACGHLLHAACHARRAVCVLCARDEYPGTQPPGSMWFRATPLRISLRFRLASGRQSARHPAPGAAYFAPGFPRRTALPACSLGRLAAALLRRAWRARRLFVVARSRRTAHHVITWAPELPPPTGASTHDQLRDCAVAVRQILQM